MATMTAGELADKLEIAIREFENALKKQEDASTWLNEKKQKLADLIGSNQNKSPLEIKEEAHRKIGVLFLEQRRNGER